MSLFQWTPIEAKRGGTLHPPEEIGETLEDETCKCSTIHEPALTAEKWDTLHANVPKDKEELASMKRGTIELKKKTQYTPLQSKKLHWKKCSNKSTSSHRRKKKNISTISMPIPALLQILWTPNSFSLD